MLVERRCSPRSRVHLYFNKYIDGQPYLCECLELSATGMLVRRIREPDFERACYAIEIARGTDVDADRLWLCVTPIWSVAGFEGLGFIAQSQRDRERVDTLLRACA